MGEKQVQIDNFFGMERHAFFFGLLENEAKKFQRMGSYLKKKP